MTRPAGAPCAITLLPLAIGAALSLPAAAQQALYSNSGLGVTNPGIATGSTTASGVAAPGGGAWSELQTDATGATNALAGVSFHSSQAAGAYRVADDFVVSGAPWTLTGATVYAYQAGPQPTITGATVRIWSGRPGDAGSVVVWGDTTTDRLLTVTGTNIYRAFNSVAQPSPPAPDAGRPIYAIRLAVAGAVLQPGTYWLDWQVQTGPGLVEAFSPAVTIGAQRGKAGANARRLVPGPGGSTGSWSDVADPGKPAAAPDAAQDLPFLLFGYSGSAPCPSDFNGDGFVNGADFDEFVVSFELGDFAADFDHNGFVNGADFDGFVAAFEGGC